MYKIVSVKSICINKHNFFLKKKLHFVKLNVDGSLREEINRMGVSGFLWDDEHGV